MSDEQAARLTLVEPADRKQAESAQLRREQVQNGFERGVFCCRDDVGGLVKHEIAKFSRADGYPVKADVRRFGIDPRFRCGDDGTVHAGAALSYRAARLAARDEAGFAEYSVKT